MSDRGGKAFLQDLFRKRGLRPKRRLGQNFLVDPNLLDYIVRASDAGNADVVLEVGVGTGQLTARLAAKARRVVGVEVDDLLFETAREALAAADNVTWIRADALAGKHRLAPEVEDAVREALPGVGGRLLLVANLAYSIATPLILTLLESALPFLSMTVTVQRELAEKLAASGPGEPGYGPVSILVRRRAEARILRDVPPQVFWPEPRVGSAIVRLDVRPRFPGSETADARFKRLVRSVFTLRRKTLHKGLETLGFARPGEGRGLLEAVGADPEARAEQLAPETFEKLAALLEGR